MGFPDQMAQALALLIMMQPAISDYRARSFNGLPVLFTGMGAGLVMMGIRILQEGACRALLWYPAGLLVGLIFLLMAYVTGEAVGYGDGVMMLVLGFLLGLSRITVILMIALSLICLRGLYLIAGRHMGGKHELPFLPYMLTAQVLYALFEAVAAL